MEDSKLELIGEYPFMDIQINVFYDPNTDADRGGIIWRARNPDSFYQGVIYQNIETGAVTYPEDAVIPEQTEQDREILPKAIVIGAREITLEYRAYLEGHLEKEYKRRNGIKQ